MLYWILFALFLTVLYILGNPLITMFKLKLQFGRAVYIRYVPIFGIISLLKKSYKLSGNAQQWIIDIVTRHPEVKFIVVNSIQYPIIILLDPEYYKQLYFDHHLVAKRDSSGIRDFLLSQGLVFSEGSKWKQQRQILGDHFLYEKLKARIPMMQQVIEEKTEGKQQIDKCYEFACSITGEVVIRSFFGEEAKGWKINEREAQIEMSDLVSCIAQIRVGSWFIYVKQKILGSKSWEHRTKKETELFQRTEKIKEDIKQIIFKRRDKIKLHGMQQNGDFLDIILNIFMNQNVYSKDRIDIEEIISQFATFFIAGTDTTAALVANCLLFLSENQQYIQQIKDEIKEMQATSENLSRFTFLEAVLKEVLRLKPSLVYPIARNAKEDIQIKDLLIKKGCILLYGNNFTNISSKHYENPLEFNPLRWLTKQPIQEDNGYINIPFAAGARNCIGQHMAMIEAKIILIHILRKYDIIRNPSVKEAKWPSRGISTYSPANAVLLKSI